MGGVTPYDEAYDMCRRDHGTLARALDRDLERFLGDYVSSQQQNYDKSVFEDAEARLEKVSLSLEPFSSLASASCLLHVQCSPFNMHQNYVHVH